MSWSLIATADADTGCFHISDDGESLVMDSDGTITVTDPNGSVSEGWHFSYKINEDTITDDETAQDVSSGDTISDFTLTNPWSNCEEPNPTDCNFVSIKLTGSCPCYLATVSEGNESVDCETSVDCPPADCACDDFCGTNGGHERNPFILNVDGIVYNTGCLSGGPDDGGDGINGSFTMHPQAGTFPCAYKSDCLGPFAWTSSTSTGTEYFFYTAFSTGFPSGGFEIQLNAWFGPNPFGSPTPCQDSNTTLVTWSLGFDCTVEGFERTSIEIPFFAANDTGGFGPLAIADTDCWTLPSSVQASCGVGGGVGLLSVDEKSIIVPKTSRLLRLEDAAKSRKKGCCGKKSPLDNR